MGRFGRQMFGSATLMAAFALATLVAGCGGGEAEKPAETAPVQETILTLGDRDVAVAENVRMEAGVPISGTLDPSESADVKAQVPGTINGIRVDAGNNVSRGQVLASIEAEGIRSQVSSAKAGIAAAEANLALAQQRAQSMKALFETGAVAKIEYDNAVTAVEAVRAQVVAMRAQATGATEQAGRATVNSPLGGTVSVRMVNNGEAVNPGQTLFKVVNASSLEVSGQIPADQRENIRVGQPVSLTLSADPDRPVRGSIARIEPVADLQTRQVRVHVRVDNPGGAIVAGQFVNGTILSEGAVATLAVPQAAVRKKGDTTFVLVVANGAITERVVTVGARDEVKGIVAIQSGLQPNEKVIIAPTVQVESGTKVRLSGDAPTNAKADTAARSK